MKIFKVFGKYAKKYSINIVMIIAITFFLNYIRSLVPLFVGKTFAILGETQSTTLPKFIDSIFDGKSVPTQILFVFLGIIITCAIRELVNIGADILIGRTNEDVGYSIQTGFYNHVQQLPYSYLNRAETGDLIQRATNDVNRVKRFVGDSFPEILSNILKLFIYSFQMFLIDTKIALVVIAFLPVILLTGIIFFRHMSPIFDSFEKCEGELSTRVQENLTGIRVAKAFANEDIEIEKHRKVINKFMKTWTKMMDNLTSYWSSGEFFSYSLLLVAFILGVFAIKEGRLELAEVVSILFFVEYIMWPTRMLCRQIGEFGRTNIAAGRILEIVDMKTEFELANGTQTPKIEGNIEFKDVSFTFSDTQIPTLKNINFDIKKGQTVAIVGRTGSGKSTLVSLLNRMLDPTSGEILVDGVNVLDIEKKYLRHNIGLVLQEPFLFSKTIAENIGIIENEIDMSVIKNVSDIAAVSNDIERFENKYKTMVGERGVTLSGGQKQRISIARILVEPKPILVFDDSLSAVDTETDLKIRNALNSRSDKATTIIITHRISTAMEADKIIVMDDGVITNIGTHEQLIEQEGLYRNIWQIQNYFEEGGE